MASLDLNELLNNSIANVVAEGQTEVNESTGLNVDLEAAGNEVADGATSTSGLALDLESVQDQIEVDLDPSILENIKGAIGAGVATYAVLEARELARIEE